MRIRLLVALVAGTVLLAAAPRAAATGQVSVTYDNNVFRLAPAELDALRLSLRPYQFPFRSADDLDIMVGSRVRVGLWPSAAIALRGRLHAFVSDWEKSYGVAALDVEQSLPGHGRVTVGYTIMPNYLIRYYREPGSTDSTRYVDCRYAEHQASFELMFELGPVELAPSYGLQLDDYVRVFDHYDTRAHRLAGTLRYDPIRNLGLELRYEFRNAKAAGPVPDISYGQHQVRASVTSWPQRFTRFGVEVGYEFARRAYTTTNSATIDPSHAGRTDNISSARVAFLYRLSDVTLSAAYEFEWRDVDSPYRPQIEDIKEYRAGRVTLGVRMNPGRRRR